MPDETASSASPQTSTPDMNGAGAQDDGQADPTMRFDHARYVGPFILAAALAFPLALLPPATAQPITLFAALGVFVGLALLLLFLPWRRYPGWVQGLPAGVYLIVVALLRHAEGGSASGYASLLLLPVLWVAMYGSRRLMAVVLVTAGAVMVGPILLFDGTRYPASEWRRVIVLLIVGATIAGMVQELVARVRRHARDSELRRKEHEITEASLAAVGLIARELSHEEDVRRQICAAARDLSGADFAFIAEPIGGGTLTVTSSLGVGSRPVEFRIDDATGTSRAFTTGRSVLVEDGGGPRLEPAIASLGPKAVLYEPIRRHQDPVGVLGVGWSVPTSELREGTTLIVRLLAAESAVAIERADLLARLDSMARTDPLTGLPNRRAWEDSLRRETARAQRSGEDFGLALLDLDHFKAYNDSHGHQAGDELLQRLAAIWQLHLRDGDVLARWGGEEFAVLLPGCDAQDALHTVERLRATIPDDQTCSAGLAVFDDGETPESLVARADRALYEAKATGRDRTVPAA